MPGSGHASRLSFPGLYTHSISVLLTASGVNPALRTSFHWARGTCERQTSPRRRRARMPDRTKASTTIATARGTPRRTSPRLQWLDGADAAETRSLSSATEFEPFDTDAPIDVF